MGGEWIEGEGMESGGWSKRERERECRDATGFRHAHREIKDPSPAPEGGTRPTMSCSDRG